MKKNKKTREQPGDFAHLIGGQTNVDRTDEDLEKRRNSLAGRLRVGNHEAARELVDIYYEKIYLYMRRLGYSREVSEDLTQESFLRAWQHAGQLRSGKALNSWLYHIASNTSRLYWRKHKGKRSRSITGYDVADGNQEEDTIVEREALQRLRAGMGRLPRKLRETVVLHYMQHLTISEAAEAAGLREGTFKSRLNRALKALRKEIG
jgi:RNA polymerase sigma-70 factor (ECF subfamily)